MYTLVLITLLTTANADTHVSGTFNSMSECFDARDQLLVDGEHYNGMFPIGSQAVCIRVEK